MLPEADALELLDHGSIEIEGRMPWSSNATLLCTIEHEGHLERAIYKPHRGERPLHDFPHGLGVREVASYELSKALEWNLVPPTVLRDGPLGVGSLQLFIEADFDQHYFTLLADERHHDALMGICVFDLVANSTDRKGGHCLIDADDHIWGIDNGLTFHREFKLRTVIWDFAGLPIPQHRIDSLCRLLEGDLPGRLCTLLDTFELDAMQTRARAVVREAVFPEDESGWRHPWPLV